MSQPSFAVVTVCKNEEEFISSTIESIINQSITPVCYYIVDDGSTDSTPEIIRRFMDKYGWIKYLRLPPSKWDIGVHYSHICRVGFEAALSFCVEQGFSIDYICLMDADTLVEKEYFNKVSQLFVSDSKIGVVSPGMFHLINNKYICNPARLDSPCGTARCWTYQCFSETGGYLLDVTPDYVSNIRARSQGWKTIRCRELLAVEQRPTSSGSKSWSGYANFGYFDYHLFLNPGLVIAKFLRLLVSQKSLIVCGYLYGYLSSFIERKKIIEDKAVRSYCMFGAVKDMWNIYVVRHFNPNVSPRYATNNIIMDDDDAVYFDGLIHEKY